MRDMPPAESKYFCTLMRFAASPCPTLPRLWRVHGFAWTCGTMAEGTSASTFSCLVIQIKWPEFWLRQFVYHVYTCTPRLPMLFVREGTFNSCHGALASAVGWYDQSKKYKDVQYHINCLRLREQMLQSWQHSIQYGVALTLHKQCASWAGAYQQLPDQKFQNLSIKQLVSMLRQLAEALLLLVHLLKLWSELVDLLLVLWVKLFKSSLV